MKWCHCTFMYNYKVFSGYTHFWKLIHVDFSSSFTWGYKVGLLPFSTTDIDMASLVTSDASFLFSTCFNHQNYRNTCSISSSFNMCCISLHNVFLIKTTNLTSQRNEYNGKLVSVNHFIFCHITTTFEIYYHNIYVIFQYIKITSRYLHYP